MAVKFSSHVNAQSPARFDSPLIVAHRAVTPGAIDNSLTAIERAAALGVDLVELDVRRSLDGVPFLFHDWHLNRATNGFGPIRLMPSSVLKRLRLRGGDGEGIPTLDAVLSLLASLPNGPSPALHIKDQRGVMVALDLLECHNMAERTWLWLHGVRSVRLAKERLPEVNVTMLESRARNLRQWTVHLRAAENAGADGASIPWPHLSTGVLAEANQLGLRTFSVVHNYDEIEERVDWGLSGMITKDPAAVWSRLETRARSAIPDKKR